MSTPHTPGPWVTKPTASLGPQWKVYSENDTRGADIAIVYDHGNTEANARLIAAAPGMLAVLEAISRDCEDCISGEGDLDLNDLAQSLLRACNEEVRKATFGGES